MRRVAVLCVLALCAYTTGLSARARWQRRRVIGAGAGTVAGAGAGTFAGATLGAEASWQWAVAAATAAEALTLPGDVIAQIESGRVVTIPNWISEVEVRALRADAAACFQDGCFKADALATYGQKKKGGFDPASDRMVMPSFYPSKGTDGPWVDSAVGDASTRMGFKSKMASLKAALSKQLQDRPTLAESVPQTHEMSYTRYGPGAFLPRHTDEHHGELKKKFPVASGDENLKRLTSIAAGGSSSSSGSGAGGGGGGGTGKKPSTTRRSVTWLVYLNEGWQPADGGQLRVHERAQPAAARVGARGPDLQIGWLRATEKDDEEPVFLDARRGGGSNCCLYACGADGRQRDLSAKPFAASPALYLAGGDVFAKRLLVDEPADQARFHLVDAPKSAASALLPQPGEAGEDGGERIRDIAPRAGTLVLFDSVSIPHEVLPSLGKERWACSGWFHEKILA